MKQLKCNVTGCGKTYTGTFAPQSMAAHKRKSHTVKELSAAAKRASAEPDGPEPEQEPAQPPPAPVAAAAAAATAPYTNGHTTEPMPPIPVAEAAPRPNTRAKLEAAVGDIDTRLVFLRREVQALEAMRREISELEAERHSIVTLTEQLTGTNATPATTVPTVSVHRGAAAQ